jgi:hypothetical protein
MTYQITVSNKGERRIEEAKGIKELHTSLSLFKSQGWEIADINRVI